MRWIGLVCVIACPQPAPPEHPPPLAEPRTCPGAPADADEALHLLPTDRIASVTVRGAVGAIALATKAGAPFDIATVRSDVHALWRATVASHVVVTATPGADGY